VAGGHQSSQSPTRDRDACVVHARGFGPGAQNDCETGDSEDRWDSLWYRR
jgi:hypothetical protein